jgi:hypothetical protein
MIRIDRFQDAASHKNMADIAEQLKGVEIERVGSLDAFKAILSILSPIIAGAIGSFVDFDVLG